jgi:hypothetical protein
MKDEKEPWKGRSNSKVQGTETDMGTARAVSKYRVGYQGGTLEWREDIIRRVRGYVAKDKRAALNDERE